MKIIRDTFFIYLFLGSGLSIVTRAWKASRRNLMAASVSSLLLTSTTMHSSATVSPSSAFCGNYEIIRSKLIGSGGTGDVFSVTANLMNPSKSKSNIASTAAVFKVGKHNSSAKLLNECDVLKYLDNGGYIFSLTI